MSARSLSPGRTLQSKGVILVHGAQYEVGALVAQRLAETCVPDKEVMVTGNDDKPIIVGNNGYELKVVNTDPTASCKDIVQLLLALQVVMFVDCVYPNQNTTNNLLLAALQAGVDYVSISTSNTTLNTKRLFQATPHVQNTKSRCVLNCGLSPGVSNLVAAWLLDDSEQTNDADVSVEFDFLYEEVNNMPGPFVMPGHSESGVMVEGNKCVSFPILSGRALVDFSPEVRDRAVFNWTRTEVTSIYHTYHPPNVRARLVIGHEFAMDWLYVFFAIKWLPAWSQRMTTICLATTLYMVFKTQYFLYFDCLGNVAIERKGHGMRIAVLGSDGVMRIHRQYHKNIYESMADIAVLQIREVMDSEDIKCGVWFPEEAFVGEARTRIIERSMEIASFSDVHSYTHIGGNSSKGAFNTRIKTNQPKVSMYTTRCMLAAVPCIVMLVYVWEWEVKWALLMTIGLLYGL